MNIPATKRLLQRDILTMIHKLKVVVPQIPDIDYQSSQLEKLEALEGDYHKVKGNHDDLKKLLMASKSNVFNIQMKYPNLKQAYDQAEGRIEEDLDQQQRELYSQTQSYDSRRKQAELRQKRFQQHSVYEEEEDDHFRYQNEKKKKEFIEELKANQAFLDKTTAELGEHSKKVMANLKETEFLTADGQIKNQPPLKEKETWVEREANEELEEFFKKADEEWLESVTKDMPEGATLKNLEPFFKDDSNKKEVHGIKGPGTYVMKNGKLVKGEGRKREEVMFSNWY
mmetsp:Transcript_4943/g.4725  ORF Transcript_4943/g.4725 Transcript_4943/m.4725 type:complete len:284 (-) Transcript_4943:214-1065(-)